MPEQHIVTPGEMLDVYRLTELIGKGGFSEVWSAWDTRINRLVALKIMPQQEDNASSIIQFQREATLVTRLEHAHILPLYDFGETSAVRYLVMRYVTGGSLAERIKDGRLPVQEVVRLMLLIADVLDYVHSRHIVHRDLKPGNILLDAQGAPYLTDFGLAKTITDETRPMHSAAGTLTFMPPEQFNGGILSPKSDMFSFGLMLYMLFAGSLPYEGRVAFGMRQISVAERLPDITHANAELPMQLNAYLWQMTDSDPARRPDSALGVMKAIAELLKNVTSVTTGPSLTSIPFTVALESLESKAYRHREAESLLNISLPAWDNVQFVMSLTHFVLLDMLLHELQELINDDVSSLMLRGALEYDQHIERWWGLANDLARQRACWHALNADDEAVSLRALKLSNGTNWITLATQAIQSKVGNRLLPESSFTEPALTLLEKTLSTSETWDQHLHDSFEQIDQHLYTLASGQSPLMERAASLIGRAKRARAALKLPRRWRQAKPLLTVYETAGSLPPEIPVVQRVLLIMRLALLQLTRNPLQALAEYGWAAAGNIVGLALIVFVSFRASSLFNSTQLLNTFALGISYGLVYGIGVWLARHIAQRLRLAPYLLRAGLGLLAGGLVMAAGFATFQQLFYSDILDPRVAVGSGLLFVTGFAISVGGPVWLQVLLGAAGVSAALLIPFASYLQTMLDEVQIRPPFIFEDAVPETALQNAAVLVVVAALLLATLTVGQVWWNWLRQQRRKTAQASVKKTTVEPRI